MGQSEHTKAPYWLDIDTTDSSLRKEFMLPKKYWLKWGNNLYLFKGDTDPELGNQIAIMRLKEIKDNDKIIHNLLNIK